MRWFLLLMLCLPSLAHAGGQTVTSVDVSDVAVTIYRDPYRDAGMMRAGWPGGYALITETRTITLPKGRTPAFALTAEELGAASAMAAAPLARPPRWSSASRPACRTRCWATCRW